MAQAEEEIEDLDPSSQEAEELDRLLEATDDPEEGEAGEKGEESPEKESRFLFSKKFWIAVGGGVLLLLASGAGTYYYLSSSSPEESKVDEAVSPPPPVESAKPTFKKVNVYALQPFFLPLKSGNTETGHFISVTAHFILSNSTLNNEIEKSLPSIRKKIYTILIRKSPEEYFLGKGKIEEKIKKEILVSVNPLLLAGTGIVNDVIFTQFVVK
jgi:flagellar basal body-associated protein FliL